MTTIQTSIGKLPLIDLATDHDIPPGAAFVVVRSGGVESILPAHEALALIAARPKVQPKTLTVQPPRTRHYSNPPPVRRYPVIRDEGPKWLTELLDLLLN